MNNLLKFWVRAALVNLCIVATLGMIMRYKIGFTFPFLDQKYLQEAHSHFAFTGWISHTLYFLIVRLFQSNLENINQKKYSLLIILNLAWAYGMLISFMFQGYGPVSIFFSSLSVITGYAFAFFALKDARRLDSSHPGRNWIRASLVLGVLSTTGTMVLSYMMATKHFNQTTYLASIYFYLHFQYNGWFIFACFGIFLDYIKKFITHSTLARNAFICLFPASIPAYLLSILWAGLPVWLSYLVIIVAILQLIGWWYFIRMIRPIISSGKLLFKKPANLLLMVVALALTLKFVLQFGSTLPDISHLAFGFRPIVIAYLHLVLLLIISMFLLAFMFETGLIHPNKLSTIALMLLALAAIANETVLATQGIAAFSYTVIPYVDRVLFGIALTLLVCALLLWVGQFKTFRQNLPHLRS